MASLIAHSLHEGTSIYQNSFTDFTLGWRWNKRIALSLIAPSMNCTNFKCGTVFISIFGNVPSYFFFTPRKDTAASVSPSNSLSEGRNARAFASVHIIATSIALPSCDHFHMDAPAPRTSSSGCATTNKYFIVFIFFTFLYLY